HLFRWAHQIRLSIALADFPRLWPVPGTAEVWWHQSNNVPSFLVLPRTPPQLEPLPKLQFPALEESVKAAAELESMQHWGVSRELVQRQAALGSRSRSRYQLLDGGTVTYEHEYTAGTAQTWSHAEIRSASLVHVERPGGSVRVRTDNRFTAKTVRI